MRTLSNAVFAGICILFFLITVAAAAASNPAEFVNPRTWSITMYDSQEASESYTIRNLENVTLTDCRIMPDGLSEYFSFEPDKADIAPGESRKFRATLDSPMVGVHEITLGVECSNNGFSFDAEGYAPKLLLNVKDDPGNCNIEVTRPVSKYISFIGLNGTYSGASEIVARNKDAKADNFTFKVEGIVCNLSSKETLINGNSQASLELSGCLFEAGNRDGKVVIESSKCDTSIYVRLSNSRAGHYFGLVKRYAGWILGGIAVLFVLFMLLVLFIPKIFKG